MSEANRRLLAFARVASKGDWHVMNELVRVWLRLAQCMRSEAQDALACHKLKLEFLRTRFLAQTCPSFRRLDAEYRKAISDLLFTPAKI